MIKNVSCHACGERDMVESQGELTCSACGARFSVEEILDQYFTLAFVRAAVDFPKETESDAENAQYDPGEKLGQEEEDPDDEESAEDLDGCSEEELERLFFADENVDVDEKVAYGIHNGLASIFENDYQGAEKYFDQVLELDEENPWAWFSEGFLRVRNIRCTELSLTGDQDAMPTEGFDNLLIFDSENPEYSVTGGLFTNVHAMGYFAQLKSIAEAFEKALLCALSLDSLASLYSSSTVMLAVAEMRFRLSALQNVAVSPSTSLCTSYCCLYRGIDFREELNKATQQRATELPGARRSDDLYAAADQLFVGAPTLFRQLAEYREYQTALDVWNKYVEPLTCKDGKKAPMNAIAPAIDAAMTAFSLLGSIVDHTADWSNLDDDWLLLKQRAARKAVELRRSFSGLIGKENDAKLEKIFKLDDAEKCLYAIDEEVRKRKQEGED